MRYWLLGGFAALAVLASGCAQMVRDQASSQAREGKYEQAIAGLEEGLRRHPENAGLRSALLATRAEAVARWTAEAARLRAAGKWNDAEGVLRRALQFDAGNDRVLALLEEISAERRVQQKLDAAAKQAAAGNKSQALQSVEQALRELPKHPAAAGLRRQLEAELRAERGPLKPRLAETRPITLDFRAAPLSVVLEAITRGSGINFVLDRDVRQDGRVTAFLREAAVEDAIDLVAGSQQLARRTIDSRTLLLYPNTAEKHREHQEQVVRVFHLAHAEAKATAQLLRTMLRLKEPFVDERANIVAIRESPETVAMAERLVALHDTGDAEVMLEVEILEVKTSRLTELGVSLPSSISLTPLGTGTSGLTLQGVRELSSSRIGVSVGNVVLNLRREAGDFNILANPRIRAKNREKARIVIGDRFPVVTSTATATGLVSENVNYLDVGLKLDVEPLVSPEDDVTIKLGLEVSAIAGSVRTERSVAYQIGTRNANTTLRLRDGETQILGGLISNDDRASASRVPGLGDLPLAGRLFSSQKDEFQRTELMLAITPRVIRSAARPDISQAELWIGTEAAPRLREAPRAPVAGAAPGAAVTAVVPGLRSVAAPSEATGAEPEGAKLAWAGPTAVKAGDVFAIQLVMTSPTALRGFIADLSYAADQLEVVEIGEGTFFKQGGAQTHFTQSVDVSAGRLSAGILRKEATGATGEGPALELRLRAKRPGTIEIKVDSLRPAGLGGAAPSARLSAFRVTAQ